jgi:maltooligosyltrehalose trehalohydrolase
MATTLRVWAPDAHQVVATVGTADPTAYPMEHEADGWWRVSVEDVRDGRYAFSLDGGEPRPDPRSLSQPDGVHGPSARVDLTAYQWGDGDWPGVPLRGAVVYELHIGTFTPEGTLDGAIARLDHLVDLGVSMVALMPVAAFPGRHGWGYDGVCLYAVHAPYGGARALQHFVDACHARGLGVLLDVVYNHLGPSGNYLGEFGPYFTERHHTPWGQAVNLDGPGSDQVRAFLLDNARMWLEDFHLDGLRLDAVHELPDERALHLLEELGALGDEVAERTGVPRTLIAESDRNDPATVSPRGPGGAGGLGLHGQWADDVHHALHVALTGEQQGYYADFGAQGVLAKVLGRTPFLHDGTLSSFRGRGHGRPVDPAVTPGWRFVASLQTHDQIGNRALGDRLCHQVSPGLAAVGAALLLTSPYTPMLFMGEEWAAGTPWQYFTDHAEPELAEAIRVGRAAEFAGHGWGGVVPDPQDEGTVAASRLDWAEPVEADHAAMLAWYRTLLRLRREVPDLAGAGLAEGSVAHDPVSGVVVVTRGSVHVVANLSGAGRQVPLGAEATGLHALACWGAAQVTAGTVRLGGHCVVLLGPPADRRV